MKSWKAVALIVAFTFLVAGCFLVWPDLRAEDKSTLDSEEISKLLADAKTESYQLKMDAETMLHFPGSELSWASHANVVEQIKGHINDVGKLLARLHNARANGSPWQEDAIDRITPLLKDLAANTTSTIEYLNDNRTKLNSPAYKDFVETNYEMSSELNALIADFADYGKNKSKFESLKNKLEVEK